MHVKGDASKARFIAAVIDNFIALTVMFLIVAMVPEDMLTLRTILLVTAYLGYFLVLEGLFGRTAGKYHQGLAIRSLDGRHADWRAVTIRTLARILEVNPALLGGLPAGLLIISSARKQRLGDILAGTVVVSDKLSWNEASVFDGPA
jgi:uncharacterized RDD family membrane protein YckC